MILDRSVQPKQLINTRQHPSVHMLCNSPKIMFQRKLLQKYLCKHQSFKGRLLNDLPGSLELSQKHEQIIFKQKWKQFPKKQLSMVEDSDLNIDRNLAEKTD